MLAVGGDTLPLCATGGADCVVRLWQLPQLELLARFTCDSAILSLQFAPRSLLMEAQLAVGTAEGSVVVLRQPQSAGASAAAPAPLRDDLEQVATQLAVLCQAVDRADKCVEESKES